METITACKLCGNSTFEHKFDAEDHFSSERFSLVRCTNCSLVITNPRPSQKDFGDYYPPSYYGEAGKRFNPILERVVQFFRKRLADKVVSKSYGKGKILEIGSGRGTLLSIMAEKGWTAVGTEFSEELVDEVADTLGVTIYQTPNLRDCQFPDDYFNAVICYHVLEHLRNPIITLDEIHRIIHPKGMLISAVPNIESFTARVSKNQWFGIDVPRHLFHFSPDTLERTLTKCGFEVTSKSSLSWEQDVFGFSQSLLNLLGFPVNIFYDLIRSPAGRIRHKFTYSNNIIGKIQIAIILFIGSILSFLGLIVAFVTSIIGSGGTLEYWSIPTRSIDE